MKRIMVYFLGVIIFCSCSIPTKIYKTGVVSTNVPLMAYEDKTWHYGYVNSETFEIVIPAKYKYTGPFINGFAMVAKKYKDYDHNKYFLINKKNEVVLKHFHYAYILESEDRKTVYALTLKHYGLQLNYGKLMGGRKMQGTISTQVEIIGKLQLMDAYGWSNRQ